VGEEEVAMAFAADVAEAVASVRELAASAQELAASAKEAQDGVAGVAAPAGEAAAATKELADSGAAAAAGADEVAGGAGKAAESLGIYADAAGRAQLANRELASSAQAAAAGEAEAGDAAKVAGDAQAGAADVTAAGAAKSDAAAGVAAGGLGKYKMALVGIGVGAAVAVDAAGKFQDQTTHLVTDAGESARNLGMVQQGILSVSAATGTSATDITNAMYHIESGGYHGAAGLALLKTAAEGAKVGGADLDTVSRTLVGTMNAYGMSASHSTAFMNQLIATVGAGDMRMQDLASSLSSVAPLAAAVHIQFAQVGGAIATMTAQGMSAQQSTQDLANTIRALSNPNNVAIAEMNQMGVNAQDVSANLGKRGLTGTISMLTQAITSRMGPSGQVIMSAFTQSTTAGHDLQVMMSSLPASLQSVARGFLDGQVSAKQWRAQLQAQTPENQKLMTQFATLYEKSHSFNSILAAGGPAAQTYEAALAKMMGGATGLNTALMLSGSRQAVFAANVKTVADAAKKGGSQVANWSTIQGTFNFKLQQAKVSVEDAGIALGTALLPAVTAILGPLAHFLALVAGNRAASIAFAVVIGGILAGALGMKLAAALRDAKEGIKLAGDGIEWLAGKLGIAAAATDAETAATEAATVAQTEFDAAADANPIGLIIIAVAALIAVIVLLAMHWRTVWHDICAVVDWAVGFIRSHWVLLVAILTGPVGLAVAELVKHWHAVEHDVMAFVNAVVNFIRSNWKVILAWLVDPVGMAVYEIRSHWQDIERVFDDGRHEVAVILDGARHDIAAAWDGIRHDVAATADAIPGDVVKAWDTVLRDTAQAWDALVRDVESAFDDVRRETETGVGDVVAWFEKLPGEAEHELERLPGDMLTIGRNVIDGLIHGIASAAADIPSLMSGLASSVESYFTDPLKIFSPSLAFFEHGVNIVQGAINGVRSKSPDLLAAVRDMAGGVNGAGSAMAASATGPAAGGQHTFNVNMQAVPAGSAYDTPQFQQYMQQQVQEAVLRYGQVNVSNGLTPAWGQ
jgi:TP901 family phage tail tape measure protein